MPSSEARIKSLERILAERQRHRRWPQTWSPTARAILMRITLAEWDELRQEWIDENAWRRQQDEEAGQVVWGSIGDPPPDWRGQLSLRDLARAISGDRPRLKAFVLAESIESRKLQMVATIREWFIIGPSPGTGAEPGIDEVDFFDSIEKVMDLQTISWDTPLPLVRTPRGTM